MKPLFPALSLGLILMLSGIGLNNVVVAADLTTMSLDEPVPNFNPVAQGETIIFTGQLIKANDLQGLSSAPINIVHQISFEESQIIVSGETDADGFFAIPWVVDVELVAGQIGGSFGQETTQGRENRFQVVVVAKFEGDALYTQSVSNAQSFEVRLNALAIKVEKKVEYLANESATIKITVVDGNGNLIEPDELTATFDNKPATLTRESVGTYTLSVQSLSPGPHQLQIRVEKIGHTSDDESISIEAMKRKTSLAITTDRSSYELGEDVSIFASLIDRNTQQVVTGKVVSGALTSPSFDVRQVTFVNGRASYTLAKTDLTGDWTISASFAGDMSYFRSSATASFNVTRPTDGVTPPTPPDETPEEKVSVSRPMVVDQLGDRLADVSVGQQVMLQARATNNFDVTEEIVYITQVKDSQGITVALSWITGTLTPGQAFELAVSWIPDAPGNYNAEVFVWKSIKDPQPLSFKPRSLPITVS